MRSVISVVVLFNLIGGWQTFEAVWFISHGQPGQLSHVLATWMYEAGFSGNFGLVGYASAVAAFIVLLSLVTAWARMRVASAVVEY